MSPLLPFRCILLIIGIGGHAALQGQSIWRWSAPFDSAFFKSQATRDWWPQSFLRNNLGNAGTINQPFIWHSNPEQGLARGWDAVSDFKAWQEDQYYRRDTIGTLVQYQQGSHKLLSLGLMHHQPISENGQITLQFKRLGSQGMYPHQNTEQYHTRLSSWFRIHSKGHLLLLTGAFRRLSMEANGGIMDSLAFFSGSQFAREGAETRLNSATRSWKENTFTAKIVSPSARYLTQLNWQNSQTHYSHERTDMPQFPAFRFDSTGTKDSAKFQEIRLTQHVQLNGKLGLWNIQGGIQGVMTQTVGVEKQQNWIPLVGITWQSKAAGLPGWQGFIQSEYYFQSKNYYSNVGQIGLKYQKDQQEAMLAWTSRINAPPVWLHTVNNNHYQWNFTFQPIQIHGFEGKWKVAYKSWRFTLSSQWQNIINLIYWDADAQPKQHAMMKNIFTGILSWTWKGKHGYWQQTTAIQPKSKIPRPLFFTHQTLAYTSPFFRSPMTLEFGLEGLYFSKYEVPVYDPMMQWFRWQDSVKVGNYPMIHIFVSGHIPGFRFFIQADHVLNPILVNTDILSKILSTPYLTGVGTPYPGFILRLGMTWFLKEPPTWRKQSI